MMMKITALVLVIATVARCQRPMYAGIRPIGYPEITTAAAPAAAAGLADRFGEGETTTQRLPVEANGDKDLVDRLSKLPIDKQPFWLINWQALEAHRQKPQTFPQKPNTFVDPIIPSSGNLNTNSGNIANPNSNPGNLNSGNLGASGDLGSNSGTPSNVNSAFSIPFTNSNTPSVPNRSSANTVDGNAASNSAVEDRFSGGIAVNKYQETDPKQGATYYYLR